MKDINIGGGTKIDLARLVETRLLVQANSGGGKSWAIRRILEQSFGAIQHVVIDSEGEFSTLREQFDYVICAPHGGDAVAHPRVASLLARRLMELKVSAILDIYELKAHERQAFVREFLHSLMNFPKNLWHPLLLVLDEAHVYCPEHGKSESASAVIDLATRGRKRGYCAVLATQRLSKLHKDAAAETLNKLIGRTGLDVDVKRAADELGMTAKESFQTLRTLKPGEFYAFGPAISTEVVKAHIGGVKTTHPKVGARAINHAPAPSAKIRAVLKSLKDIPQEAEVEAKTMADLRAEITKLKRELTMLRHAAENNGVPEKEVERRIKEAVMAAKKEIAPPAIVSDVKTRKALERILQTAQKALDGQGGSITSHVIAAPARRYKEPDRAEPSIDGLRSGAVRILAELAARNPAGYSKAQVGTLTGFAPKGGTFNTYLGDLRRAGFIEERAGLIYATARGIEALGDQVPPAPTSHEEAMGLWRKALRDGAFRMLEFIVDSGEAGVAKDVIAAEVGMTMTGGTFNTYLGDLRRNGLAVDQGGVYVATDVLFPGGHK